MIKIPASECARPLDVFVVSLSTPCDHCLCIVGLGTGHWAAVWNKTFDQFSHQIYKWETALPEQGRNNVHCHSIRNRSISAQGGCVSGLMWPPLCKLGEKRKQFLIRNGKSALPQVCNSAGLLVFGESTVEMSVSGQSAASHWPPPPIFHSLDTWPSKNHPPWRLAARACRACWAAPVTTHKGKLIKMLFFANDS